MKLTRQLPLNALKVFEAAARQLSFTKAGAELGMTQTAVSHQIRLLEERLGEALFLRRPRQVVLTEAGAALAPKVTEAFDTLEEALAAFATERQTVLHIHANPTFASQWLAHRIGVFQVRHPDITVRLSVENKTTDPAKNNIDVVFYPGRGDRAGIVSHRILPVTFTPMLSPALADSVGGIHTPADLLKLRIIDPGDPWWKTWFTAAGLPDVDLSGRPRSQMGVQAFEAKAAVNGSGVAILTPELYPDDMALNRLYQPFDLVCRDGHHYCWGYPEARRNAAKIRLFRDWMADQKMAGAHQGA
ncbi:LysR family transcriptional regulator [Rhizobium halophytocola]|uniref:LysR family glycine cleavage system transcriptional activator n=1 Tax=Rhizobium halophytocola TaxID=735519 RepID=A0ABS4DSB0_9HYPH|nr:LysR family transcriptional regulator [Rhizobium halophytocola]MBP1848589.1 LysR family glycine cleavage system transcriptional activator [Rhizobium halophytocola]